MLICKSIFSCRFNPQQLTVMASQGTLRIPGKDFRVDGQAMKKTQGCGSDGTPIVLHVPGGVHGEESVPALTQLLGFNQTLQLQIETLRMRLAADSNSHEKDKCSAVEQTEKIMKEKQGEINELKLVLATQEGKIGNLENENKNKGSEIEGLQQHIMEIKRDISASRSYANDLQKELKTIQAENKRLGKSKAYEAQEGHIAELQKEVDALRVNLETMEKELEKARTIIAAQGKKLWLFESDKSNMQAKFKEELSRMSHTMRHEMEKMREVVRKQWEEMRLLREQNEEMGRDIKDIKNILVMTQQNRSKSPPGYGQVFKPTLPSLTKDTKRILTGKKK